MFLHWFQTADWSGHIKKSKTASNRTQWQSIFPLPASSKKRECKNQKFVAYNKAIFNAIVLLSITN
jgi:hypothetical protein